MQCGMVMPVQLTRDQDRAQLLVRSCEPGVITIGDRQIRSHFLVFPDRIRPDWPVDNVAALTAIDFDEAAACEPDLIVLGTGQTLAFPRAEVSAALLARGIGFEVMDTRAACRTYNVLVMDGRSVVAALMQISAE